MTGKLGIILLSLYLIYFVVSLVAFNGVPIESDWAAAITQAAVSEPACTSLSCPGS